MLEHQRGLEVHIGVETRGEQEVAAQERAGRLVEIERFALGHGVPSSATTAAAAAAGSRAALIARPTTR